MIYTSYFANMRYLDDLTKSKCVSISLFSPKGYKGKQFNPLIPTINILTEYKKDNDTEKYERSYKKEVLSRLDPIETAKYLDGKILICFETPEKFCHRHIVSQWFRDNGIDCFEIVPHNKEIMIQQPGLF